MDITLFLLQALLMLFFAPLLQGVIKRLKATMQNRRGPSIWQPYRDIRKLLAREAVFSERASWVARVAPFIYAAGIAAGAMLIPTFAQRSAAAGIADAVVLVGLFALARFALALGALDTGSNFGGMGASREITFAALIEPALFLVLYTIAIPRGSTSLSMLVGDGGLNAADFLGIAALLIVVIAETGRIPIDNPDTHLELTMAHEGMVLEYSGRPLGIIHWASQIKQLALVALFSTLFFPWGMTDDGDHAIGAIAVGFAAFALKAFAIGAVLAVVETAVAKLRVFRAPDLLGLASVLGIFAVMATYFVDR